MSTGLSTNRLLLDLLVDFSSDSISIAVRREVELDSIRIPEAELFELPATTGFDVEDLEDEVLELRGIEVFDLKLSEFTIGALLVCVARSLLLGYTGESCSTCRSMFSRSRRS